MPNGEIKVASNLTRVWARINQDVTVAYGTDIDKAIEVVDEVGREMADDPVWKRRVLEAPRVERVEALGEYGVTLKILGTVRAPDQWAAARRVPQAAARRVRGATASRSRGRSASTSRSRDPARRPDRPARHPTEDDLAERHGLTGPAADRPAHAATDRAVGWPRPADHREAGPP